MKIKTNVLTGSALDWAVAKCKRYSYRKADQYDADGLVVRIKGEECLFMPSTNWAHGGPIIKREKIGVTPASCGEFFWVAEKSCEPTSVRDNTRNIGPTPLIAAMRCYIASKLGNEVEIPKELK